MARVSEVDDPEAPIVLLVDNNEMSIMRMKQIFKQKEFNVVECRDGDKAVDAYIKTEPELVVLALDIPTLDGHVAALEMREHGGDCRILLIAPARQRELAEQAAYSAGAVGWLEKPVSSSSLDEIWEQVLGPIPEAPGLKDLDELHPMQVEVELATEEKTEVMAVLPPVATLVGLSIDGTQGFEGIPPPKQTKTTRALGGSFPNAKNHSAEQQSTHRHQKARDNTHNTHFFHLRVTLATVTSSSSSFTNFQDKK